MFADPPYAYGDKVAGVLAALVAAAAGWRRTRSWSSSARRATAPAGWADASITSFAEKRYGETRALVRSRPMKPPVDTGQDGVIAKVRRAMCPGSFDPVTNGHLDIIGRAAALYDEVVVAVFVNQSKSSLFTVDERREMLLEETAHYGNVRSTPSRAWSSTTAAPTTSRSS